MYSYIKENNIKSIPVLTRLDQHQRLFLLDRGSSQRHRVSTEDRELQKQWLWETARPPWFNPSLFWHCNIIWSMFRRLCWNSGSGTPGFLEYFLFGMHQMGKAGRSDSQTMSREGVFNLILFLPPEAWQCKTWGIYQKSTYLSLQSPRQHFLSQNSII